MTECRACRQVAGSAERHPLFENGSSNGTATFRRYNLLTSIEIKPPIDERWTHLCSQCENKLIDFEHFRNQCIESDEIIRNLRTNHAKPAVKKEPLENHPPPSPSNDDIFESESANHANKEDDDDDDDSTSASNSTTTENIKSQHDDNRRHDRNPPKSASKSRTKSKKPSDRFECDMCGKTFLKKHRIEAHLRTHVGLKPFCCAACPSTFRKFSSLRMHEKRKHAALATGNRTNANRRYPCTVAGCPKTYMESGALQTHVKRVHRGEKPEVRVVCELCGEAFFSGWSLKEHMYRHREPSAYPYACAECPKRFINKYTFQMHVKRHENMLNYQCTQCEMRATTQAKLDAHMECHNQALTISCDQCQNMFTTPNGLRQHMRRVHEGYRPYCCAYCNQCFASRTTMLSHAMRHTGEKPHACPVCERRFRQPVTLKAHMKVHAKQQEEAAAAAASAKAVVAGAEANE